MNKPLTDILERLYAAGVTAGKQIPEKTGLGMVIAGDILVPKAETAINEYIAGIIGPDVPIFVDGKLVKRGDTMEMDLLGGVNSPKFQESCKNIQENGRNLEKAAIRKRAGIKPTEEET